MDISEQRHLKTQLELDVEALADYMLTVDNSDGQFDMQTVSHTTGLFPCGTPACAYGHCNVWNPNMAKRFYKDHDCWDLFQVSLSQTVRTPKQWSAHARAWLAARK